MLLATAAASRTSPWARFSASGACCVLYVAAIAALAIASRDRESAVYALSFWHYYLYWLAYRFGAVPLAVFKRDAMLMKSVTLGLAILVYLSAPLHLLSLAVVAGGFSLNVLGAWALGADRTYYGYELADLPRRRITRFPYSWTSHPMLLGNVVAFGGTVLNPPFRIAWWPLACAHVALNLGLLAMEVFVSPRRGLPAAGSDGACGRARHWQDVGYAVASAMLGTGFGCWALSRTSAAAAAGFGGCTAAFAYAIYRCYAGGQRPAAKYQGRTSDER